MTKLQAEIVGLAGTSRGRERGLVGRGGVGTKVSSCVVCQRLTGPASKGTEQSRPLVPPALGPLTEHQPPVAETGLCEGQAHGQAGETLEPEGSGRADHGQSHQGRSPGSHALCPLAPGPVSVTSA